MIADKFKSIIHSLNSNQKALEMQISLRLFSNLFPCSLREGDKASLVNKRRNSAYILNRTEITLNRRKDETVD